LFTLLNNGCKKPDYIKYNTSDADLTLAAVSSDLKLSQREDGNDALILSWTPGSNKGTNSSIAYTLKIDKQGNQFSGAVTQELGLAIFGKKFTVKDLNNLLLDHWKVAPGIETTLEARIIAKVSGDANII